MRVILTKRSVSRPAFPEPAKEPSRSGRLWKSPACLTTRKAKTMTVFGKPASAYVAFSKGVAFLILVVGIIRLALSLGGVSNSTTKWISMNGAYLIGLFYLAIRVHTTGFGTYKHLLPALVPPGVVFHSIAIAGIAIGIAT